MWFRIPEVPAAKGGSSIRKAPLFGCGSGFLRFRQQRAEVPSEKHRFSDVVQIAGIFGIKGRMWSRQMRFLVSTALASNRNQKRPAFSAGLFPSTHFT